MLSKRREIVTALQLNVTYRRFSLIGNIVCATMQQALHLKHHGAD